MDDSKDSVAIYPERNENSLPRLKQAIGIALMLVLVLSGRPASADERSFQIVEVNIDAHIDRHGDMHVVEEDTYLFDGQFNGIFIELGSAKSDGIVDFQAFEVSGQDQVPLTFELTSDGDNLHYRIYSSSVDESKTFRFAYTVKNVVQVYADTAELYWKFFDERNPSTLASVNIAIELPDGGERESIRAFGHGPSHGVVNVEDDGTVRYEISPLPAGQLLEARVLFPGASVPGSTRISDEAMLDAILKEEQNWAEGDAGEGNMSGGGALVLLLINLSVGIYIKWFRKFKPAWKGDYYRDLPGDVTPAVVGYLMSYRVKPRDLMATMADLARKKHVAIQVSEEGSGRKGKTDYRFRLSDDREDRLLPHESMLVDWFFRDVGTDNEVSLAELRRYAKSKANANAFTLRWSQWKKEVEQAAYSFGYIESQKRLFYILLFAGICQFFGFWFLAPENWKWLMFCAIPLFFLLPKRKRRTKQGQTEYAKWSAFKRFLRDYSRMASREPLAVHLWGHYFVYAISLNEAKRMIAVTRLQLSNSEQAHVIDYSYLYHYEHWSGPFEKSIHTAFVYSGSSGGGSFSSGGGGGGGGGGRGAF